jgi:hypothetical protein
MCVAELLFRRADFAAYRPCRETDRELVALLDKVTEHERVVVDRAGRKAEVGVVDQREVVCADPLEKARVDSQIKMCVAELLFRRADFAAYRPTK